MERTYLLALVAKADADLETLTAAELAEGWGAFLVHPSRELAAQVIEGLQGWGNPRLTACFKVAGSGELSRTQCVAFELQMEALDRRLVKRDGYQAPIFFNSGPPTVFPTSGDWDPSPWLDLRRDALRMLEVLSRLKDGRFDSPQSVGPEPTVGTFAVKDLAEKFGVPRELLRKRLDRWRASNLAGYTENSNARRGEPRFLYDVTCVLPILRELQASVSASAKRPPSRTRQP